MIILGVVFKRKNSFFDNRRKIGVKNLMGKVNLDVNKFYPQRSSSDRTSVILLQK